LYEVEYEDGMVGNIMAESMLIKRDVSSYGDRLAVPG
jgi:hypothetical protein